ncbi:MAG: DNA-binding response regulator [Pseudomonadota bacterium]
MKRTPRTVVDLAPKSIALVVDDDPASLGMLATALEGHGMTVLVARDGREAVTLTRRVQPDVILMDAVMPEMDGFEACRVLKSGPDPILAPIVFMTGLSDREHVVAGLAAGGVDYVTKPVVIEELMARLGTHIVNARLIKSARSALDTSDHAVMACDAEGRFLWGSKKTTDNFEAVAHILAQPEVTAWIGSCVSKPVSDVQPFESDTLTLQFMGVTVAREILIKLIRRSGARNEDVLSEAFGLTLREAEVLFWLTMGKTNRDISTILALSPRTVNKHLEQVFQKMGVDNRTSAAVLADRKLSANA